MFDPNDDAGGGGSNDSAGGSPQNWWEGPRPAGYTGPWPPPLPPGASYGPQFGQIIYGQPTPIENTPGYTPPTDTTTSPDYHPEYYGNQPTAPGPSNPPSTPGPNPGPGPAAAASSLAPSTGSAGPTFTPPDYTKPPAFSYADFVAPDPSELDKDPNYLYTLKTEQDRIQKSAAARGILNTGGTINDLLLNAKDIAATGYRDLYSRAANTYAMNRQNAVDEYNTNYGTQYVDPFKFSYSGLSDAYQANQHNYDLGKQYSWYQNLFDYQQQQDLWDRKFKLLGLA